LVYVVGTYENQRYLKLYVNGVLVGNKDLGSGSTLSATQRTRIGNYASDGSIVPNESFNYNGKLGEIRVYNRSLTSTEILQNFQNTRERYGV